MFRKALILLFLYVHCACCEHYQVQVLQGGKLSFFKILLGAEDIIGLFSYKERKHLV